MSAAQKEKENIITIFPKTKNLELIFVISGSNLNVMFELGLSYGLGKETILLKKSDTKPISDLSNVEYIEYRHAKDIQDKLFSYFNK